jgi:uncharacterized protein (DUF302 family)
MNRTANPAMTLSHFARTLRRGCGAALIVFTYSMMGSAMTVRAAPPDAAPDAVPAALVTLPSPYDFAATVARLKETLNARGLTVFADIDQSEAAARVGMPLRPTRLLLFGNPRGGTPVMVAHPHAALELPLRAVVWEDDARHVFVDYQDVTKTLPAYGVDAQLLEPLRQVPALLRSVLQQ